MGLAEAVRANLEEILSDWEASLDDEQDLLWVPGGGAAAEELPSLEEVSEARVAAPVPAREGARSEPAAWSLERAPMGPASQSVSRLTPAGVWRRDPRRFWAATRPLGVDVSRCLALCSCGAATCRAGPGAPSLTTSASSKT